MIKILNSLTYESLYGVSDVSIAKKDIKECLLKLKRVDALRKCLEINFGLFLNQNNGDYQTRLINENFNKTGIRKIYKILEIENKDIKEICVFYRGQIINLIWYILIYCPSEGGLGIKDGEKFSKNFRKCILIVSDLINAHVHDGKWQNTHDSFQDSVAALPAIRQSMEYSNHLDMYSKKHYLLLSRGYSIFVEIFSGEFKRKFFEKFNISLEDFYSIIFAIIGQLLNYSKTWHFNLDTFVKPTKKSKEVKELLLKISLTPEELLEEIKQETNNIPAENYEARAITTMEKILRGKPFLRIPNNEILLTDATYLIQFATVGPLFCLTKSSNREIFKHYGECFEVYTQSQLKRIFSDKKIINNHSIQRGRKKEGCLEIDAYIENGDKIFLIEIKSTFINNAKKLSEELERKYCQKQGIHQLAKSAKLLSIKSKKEINEIFPILVVHDSLLDDTEFLLNKKFKKMLDGSTKTITIKIHPLTIISIDVLELLPTNINLERLLLDYFNYINHQTVFITSIGDYIMDSNYRNELYINPDTMKKIEKILKNSKGFLFSEN